jgi:hypothetical protein
MWFSGRKRRGGTPGKRNSEEQIVYTLRQLEWYNKVSEVCRELGNRSKHFTDGGADTPGWD